MKKSNKWKISQCADWTEDFFTRTGKIKLIKYPLIGIIRNKATQNFNQSGYGSAINNSHLIINSQIEKKMG